MEPSDLYMSSSQSSASSTSAENQTTFLGLPIDQVYFLVCQLISLFVGSAFRNFLPTNSSRVHVRYVFAMVLGILIPVICFGKQAFHLFVMASSGYVIMKLVPLVFMPQLVLVSSLAYLAFNHIYRQIYDYGSYTLDVTGPLMIMTQRVSSLAFSIQDGLLKSNSDLSEDQQKMSVKIFPDLLKYFSYMHHFQALLCGPLVFYNDYIDFIEGRNLYYTLGEFKAADENSVSQHQTKETVYNFPSPTKAVIQKLVTSLLAAAAMLFILPLVPITRLSEDDFKNNTPFLQKMLYIIVATTTVRVKYYHAWLLADAICNASGLGFVGFKPDGSLNWDGVSNVQIYLLETSLSFRDCLAHWNQMTMVWLRRTVYDRVTVSKTVVTYALSAFWHGFYPGYYLTFFTAALVTLAARNVRRHIRPYFQKTLNLSRFYDVATCLSCRVALAYTTFPFVLLEFMPSIQMYMSMYCWLHILALLAIFVLPLLLPSRRPTEDSKKTN